MSAVEDRLAALGLILPAVPAAVASYVPARVVGDFVFTSGQLPFESGRLLYSGRVGESVTVEDAQRAARQAALNALAAAAEAAGGLSHLVEVVRVVGYIQGTAEFHEQAQVLNGASELLEAVFGPAGRHARAAVGVSSLPLNAPVEVEVLFRRGG